MAQDTANSSKNLALRTIQNKIEFFISSNKYHDLEEFIADNPDLTTFQNHTKLNNTLRRVWGYQITEQEYLDILEELKRLDAERKQINMENVKTVHANGKDIITYQGEDGTMILDTSYNSKPMKEQLEDLQKQDRSFQTGGANNIENMMKDMQNRIKPVEQQLTTSEASNRDLSQEEKVNLEIAKDFEEQTGEPVQVDLENGVIFHNGEAHAIEERNNSIGVYSAEEYGSDTLEKENKQTSVKAKTKAKVKQKTLKQQAGFSNTFILVFIAGVVMGFIAISAFLP